MTGQRRNSQRSVIKVNLFVYLFVKDAFKESVLVIYVISKVGLLWHIHALKFLALADFQLFLC